MLKKLQDNEYLLVTEIGNGQNKYLTSANYARNLLISEM